MRPEDALAVVVSDLHLSEKPPAARAGEEDWWRAQFDTFMQAEAVAHTHGVDILIAGDIFDRWSPPVELVNKALAMFQECRCQVYAVPGQHDLPYHRYNERTRSAYGNLMWSGALVDISAGTTFFPENSAGRNFAVTGFPWGSELQPWDPPKRCQPLEATIALCHRYVWQAGYGYTGAATEHKTMRAMQQLRGYDFAVFGDNHKGFMRHGDAEEKFPTVINCGGMMRRNSDELDRQPAFYLLGWVLHQPAVERFLFDTSKDNFEVVAQIAPQQPQAEVVEFVRSLRDAAAGSVDYAEAVVRYCTDTKPKPSVTALLLEAIGHGK
jgi:Calcineurin-like phosphoesterase